ncbi:unnamed protein product [Trifolium pratense]|uniref:Uncharacterized protein n=1 Tax=Trifolium pratense TaxID=57577 RepID=A0ACB0IVG4_TRIPR|nr:unnamed protein product [Trifolium pratense]
MSVVESVNIFFSSNPTKTAGKDNRDDKQDNDSTASSPVVKQRDHSRRLPATERKTRKSNILETLRASSSAPPKSNLKGRTDDRDFKEIRKNLFCRPDEEDDSDFYLNYHPAASIGYEGLDINFHIPSAIFIEEILMHESYGQLLPGFNQDRLVSTFSLYQPRHIQQQRPGSNDCGVWVSKWMIECPLRSEYGYVTVNTATRMKLAIHLVKAANNELYDEVLAKAAESWRAEEERRKNLVKI